MAKFAVQKKVVEFIYGSMVDKKTASNGVQTSVNLGSGVIANFAAAIISQPANTILSKINKTKGAPGEGTTTRLIKITKELGVRGLFTGVGTCMIMVGAGQFSIYGDLNA